MTDWHASYSDAVGEWIVVERHPLRLIARCRDEATAYKIVEVKAERDALFGLRGEDGKLDPGPTARVEAYLIEVNDAQALRIRKLQASVAQGIRRAERADLSHQETVAARDDEIASLEEELATLREELAQLRPRP